MGTSAIRQGNPLYFAQSLVWRITMDEFAAYTAEQLSALSEASRYEMFLTTWERHLKAGLEPSQREAERIAGLYGVKANVAEKVKPNVSFALPEPVGTGRRRNS